MVFKVFFPHFCVSNWSRQVFGGGEAVECCKADCCFSDPFLIIAKVSSEIQGQWAGRGSCSLILRAVTWPCSALCPLPCAAFGCCLPGKGNLCSFQLKKALAKAFLCDSQRGLVYLGRLGVCE